MGEDKDKNVIEQLVDKVNDFVETITNTASDALDDVVEPASVRPNKQAVPSYEFPVPDSPATSAPVQTKKRATKKTIGTSKISGKKAAVMSRKKLKRKTAARNAKKTAKKPSKKRKLKQ
jgi:hypothetical protein